jgi:hypothetical protein
MTALQRWCLRVSGVTLVWLGVIVMARGVLDCRGGWACAVVALGSCVACVGVSLLRCEKGA